MTTQQDTTITTTDVSNAERIGKAVSEVAKRIRIQDFDIVGIRGTLFGGDPVVTVSIQTDNRRNLIRAIAYFRLDNVRDVAGGITVTDATPVVGLLGAKVDAFGPTITMAEVSA